MKEIKKQQGRARRSAPLFRWALCHLTGLYSSSLGPTCRGWVLRHVVWPDVSLLGLRDIVVPSVTPFRQTCCHSASASLLCPPPCRLAGRVVIGPPCRRWASLSSMLGLRAVVARPPRRGCWASASWLLDLRIVASAVGSKQRCWGRNIDGAFETPVVDC